MVGDSSVWPVLVAVVLLSGQLDDSHALILPHHAPEVVQGVGQGVLGGYVGPELVVTLHHIMITVTLQTFLL